MGPFDLIAPLGAGGMGEVWKGVHRRQNLPVAVKVITAVQARRPEFRQAFRNEARAVAGLDHPGIVMVFDHGDLPPEAEERSLGRLHAGSPYLVMELLTGGSLSSVGTAPDWHWLKATLLSLLDSLAHAHARNVLHRDLKPNNVLLGGLMDARPGLKIIDFGLAMMEQVEGLEESGLTAGTPAYEAPEKILGQVRDQGPWTDLYSLGCVAYSLAAGRPPFDGDAEQLQRCHLMVPAPDLTHRIPVPTGFEGWIRRLMMKHPNDRFRRAADAAYALESLSEEEMLAPRLRRKRRAGEATDETTAVTRPYTVPLQARNRQLPESAVGVGHEEAAPVRIRPVPTSWRDESEAPSSHPVALIGAGLGLFGLRAVPLVNRFAERDHLWAGLRRVAQTGRSELVLLRGESGLGKTRLVRWLTERAHQAGSAGIVHTHHGPQRSAQDGIPRLLGREFGCLGLDRTQTQERVKRVLTDLGDASEYRIAAMTELIVPATTADRSEGERAEGERVVRFRSPAARYTAVRRHLERLAEERPLIIWIDDVQWGSDAVGLARHVLKRQERHPAPLYFVLTLRDDGLDPDSVERSMLDDLMSMDLTSQVPIGPLTREDCSQLVQELLGLEGSLAHAVEKRSGGNPLFAVQLVGDWVHRGVLDLSQEGFVLREGEQAEIPDDLHDLWASRVDRLLGADETPDSRSALELAAALGQEVRTDEWRAVCALGDVTIPDDLVERLVSQRLADRWQGGWRVVHGMLRESLKRTASEAGRWRAHNLLCAGMLAPISWDEPGVAERLGRHLVDAEAYLDAVAPLLEGARMREDASEYRTARSLLTTRRDAMEAGRLPAEDPAWGQGSIVLVGIHNVQGRLDDALALAERTAAEAERYGWDEVAADAQAALGYVAHQQGAFDEAIARYRQALEGFERLEHPVGEANCLIRLGQVSRLTGHLDNASDLISQALDVFQTLEDRRGISMCLRNLGVIAQHGGETTRAIDLLERSRSLYETAGNQYGVALVLNDLAEISRVRGALEEAENGYRKALDIFAEIGSSDGVVTEMNLGLILLLKGEYQAARGVLEQTVVSLDREGRRWFLGAVHSALLPCVAIAGDWPAWDEHINMAQSLLAETNVVDSDVAWTLELGAEIAEEAGQPGRARDAYNAALAQWRILGDDTRARDLEAILEAE